MQNLQNKCSTLIEAINQVADFKPYNQSQCYHTLKVKSSANDAYLIAFIYHSVYLEMWLMEMCVLLIVAQQVYCRQICTNIP